jgi:hypothetical protein
MCYVLFTTDSFILVNEPQPRAVKRIRLSATEMSFEDNTTLFQQIIMKVSKLVEGKDSMDFHFVMKSARWVIMTIQKLLRV